MEDGYTYILDEKKSTQKFRCHQPILGPADAAPSHGFLSSPRRRQHRDSLTKSYKLGSTASDSLGFAH
jgi:hypothetical protein